MTTTRRGEDSGLAHSSLFGIIVSAAIVVAVFGLYYLAAYVFAHPLLMVAVDVGGFLLLCGWIYGEQKP